MFGHGAPSFDRELAPEAAAARPVATELAEPAGGIASAAVARVGLEVHTGPSTTNLTARAEDDTATASADARLVRAAGHVATAAVVRIGARAHAHSVARDGWQPAQREAGAGAADRASRALVAARAAVVGRAQADALTVAALLSPRAGTPDAFPIDTGLRTRAGRAALAAVGAAGVRIDAGVVAELKVAAVLATDSLDAHVAVGADLAARSAVVRVEGRIDTRAIAERAANGTATDAFDARLPWLAAGVAISAVLGVGGHVHTGAVACLENFGALGLACSLGADLIGLAGRAARTTARRVRLGVDASRAACGKAGRALDRAHVPLAAEVTLSPEIRFGAEVTETRVDRSAEIADVVVDDVIVATAGDRRHDHRARECV